MKYRPSRVRAFTIAAATREATSCTPKGGRNKAGGYCFDSMLHHEQIRRIVSSFGFSVALAVLWAGLTWGHIKALFANFTWTEFLFVLHSEAIVVLFLIRRRPSVISLDPVHWVVALITSFAGLFLSRTTGAPAFAVAAGNALIAVGLLTGTLAGIQLGRCYDFIPALRGVATRSVYGLVRHPMYLSSMIVRLGYVLQHPSVYNTVLYIVMVWLYDRRAAFEEQIMLNDPRYQEYVRGVRFRFLPLIH